ncbi:MAG: RluA family pseudouridine synthase [Alcaligenaceae bacterium]|nr:RluA family pseudouridine synthase [Alcaligenaceae bacterium]
MSDTTNTPNDEFIDTEPRVFRVPSSVKGDRLDKILAQLIPEHSRSRLQSWIESGYVTVNEKPGKVRQIISADDLISVLEPVSEESLAFTPEPIDFNVLGQSSQWIVVEKPAGLVTHPGAGNWHGTLLNGLLYRFPELAHVPRAGIVHRLDKDTSGLLVVARTEQAQTHLVRQLQARTVGREYVALVSGQVKPAGTITSPIGRDRKVPVRMSANNPVAPKEACTHYTLLASGMAQDKEVCQVRCKLETGRTHQIRVHLSSIGHPLLGDELYGGKPLAGAQRQMLHARRLQFIDPESGKLCEFESEMAQDMQQVIASIEWK